IVPDLGIFSELSRVSVTMQVGSGAELSRGVLKSRIQCRAGSDWNHREFWSKPRVQIGSYLGSQSVPFWVQSPEFVPRFMSESCI
uniref:Uncharacterized protein n=1 Tax=Cannabis sativa TaxID=3483 RepID=A0A803PKT3_CANSA